MNYSKSNRSESQGSSLIAVIMLMLVMAILTAGTLSYSIGERRGNERNRLILRSKNMAENIALYSAEQLIPKLNRMGSAPVGVFPWTGTSANRIYIPPASVLNTAYTSSTVGMEMRCGIESHTDYALVNDVNSPNNGLQVSTAKVPIISKATATHPALGSFTAYVEQDMQLSLTPLFQFGIFYNMDLEFFPGQDMTIMGPVHTNGRLAARGEQGGTAVVTFAERVTAAQGLYANGQIKATYIKRAGTVSAGDGGTGAVYYTSVANVQTNLKSSGGIWRDHKWGGTTETASTVDQFKTFATTTYGGNVRTNAHGVSKLELPGIGSYSETNLTTTGEDDRNNGRQIIEPRNPFKWTGSAWVVDTDDAATRDLKLSRRAGLYIIVNPDDAPRIGKLPDGSNQPILPRSYRCWLNIVNSDSTHTMREVVLPGQPSYGYNDGGTAGSTAALMADDTMYHNLLPNRYTPNTFVGPNQVLSIPHQGYGNGTDYQINGAFALGATDLAIDTGTGTIQVGDALTIKSGTSAYQYLVTAAPVAGVVKIAAPGLRSTAADGDLITVAAGTGTGYKTNGAHASGATSITVDTGTGTILPGNILFIDGRQYLVTTALASGVVVIASPGLSAAVADNTRVTVAAASGLLGSGTGYVANGSAALGATALTVDTGTGTILPGNILTIVVSGTTYQYLVTSALNGNVIKIASPGFVVAVPDNTAITVGPAVVGTGKDYQINGAQAINATTLPIDTGTGTILPGNILGIGSQKYLVVSASPTTPPHTSVRIAAPGLVEAVADNSMAIVDPYSDTGYVRTGGSGYDYPTETSTLPYPANAYFFDLRRADGNVGYNSNIAAGSARASVNYVPRAIAKIDFDVARFKMTVNRSLSDALTSTGYKVGPPNAGSWTNSIYNAAGVTTALDLGMDDDNASPFTNTTFPVAGTAASLNRMDPYRLYYTPEFLTPSTPDLIPSDPSTLKVPASDLNSAWYDGIAIYIHSVDAERRAQTVTAGKNDRIDSGVRLINGRGPVISLATTAKTGFTFVTNDAAYIIGHFNADGSVNATSTATGNGGYSARYPDSAAEKLTSVMADAVTLLAQPVFNGTTYAQTNGWNDALSAFRVTNATWTNTWRSASPSSSNSFEGLGTDATAIKPGALPTSSTPGTAGTATWETKLPTVDTEFSVALLMGLVPSNHNAVGLTDRPPRSAANAQYSGGAHNFPRLLEDWHNDMGSGSSSGLYIRGSMVALFESRVAMEPWNIRCYQAPERYWGLHEGFRGANHEVPLEPIVLGADRLGFRELSATEYATRKTSIEAMTAIP